MVIRVLFGNSGCVCVRRFGCLWGFACLVAGVLGYGLVWGFWCLGCDGVLLVDFGGVCQVVL